MDYTVEGARQAGFQRIVVVTRSDLDGAMRRHLTRLGRPTVELVHQPAATFGTVSAVLAARRLLTGGEPFAVVNADDLYPPGVLPVLREWTMPGHPGLGHAVVGFRLAATMLAGSGPVNRALCHRDGDGRLRRLTEATITALPPAPGVAEGQGRFVARELGAGTEAEAAGDQLVSMNAWAFRPSIWPHFAAAAGAAAAERRAGCGAVGAGEVLLPVVVDALISRGAAAVTVVPVEGRCVGITWPDELAVVRELVGRLVAAGQLPVGTRPRPVVS